jgi:hypothetical protein
MGAIEGSAQSAWKAYYQCVRRNVAAELYRGEFCAESPVLILSSAN